MSGTPLNRSSPPRDEFALLAGGGRAGDGNENENESKETIVDAVGAEVFNVVVPVAACIALTSFLVQVLNPSGASGTSGVTWASAAYKEKVRRDEVLLFNRSISMLPFLNDLHHHHHHHPLSLPSFQPHYKKKHFSPATPTPPRPWEPSRTPPCSSSLSPQ